jgi:hypothetical protein
MKHCISRVSFLKVRHWPLPALAENCGIGWAVLMCVHVCIYDVGEYKSVTWGSFWVIFSEEEAQGRGPCKVTPLP